MSENKKKWPYQKEAKKVILGVVGLWGLSALVILVGANRNSEVMGITGDAFGAINALFSGLAFSGLIYAILLQKEELELQRQEVRDTRQEIQGQRKALEAQSQTLKKQNFETTLFQMISLHNEIVNSLNTKNDNNRLGKGRGVF